MGKKKREEDKFNSEASEPVVETKRARKGPVKVEKVETVKGKSHKTTNSLSEKGKGKVKESSGEAVRKPMTISDTSKNLKAKNVYTDSSSSSDSESEKNSNRNDKKVDSNSDSDSESSDSDDSSPTSREGHGDKVKGKTQQKTSQSGGVVVNQKNSITNLIPAKSYVPPAEKSSSSDSYHSDTEEEDKKRRKKQKKMLQMQLSKKAKKSNLPKAAEIKTTEIQSDLDEDGPDNVASNNDEVPDWPESDYAELIRRMESQIPPKDNQKFDSRAAKLDWGKIAFGDYSSEECMEVWLAISKRIRRYRTLAEILQDAREWVTKPWTNFYRGHKKNRHPDMPPRPLSTYMIYYLEQKDKVAKENPGLEMTQVSKIISEMYKNLSSDERDKYTELAAKERQNFEAKLMEFYKEHPDIAQQQQQRKTQAKEVTTKGPRKASNPFKLFFQEQLKKHGGEAAVDKKAVEEEAKEKWKNLSDKKKLVWIDWALQDLKRYEDEMKVYKMEHPEYIPPNSAKSVLNKDERNIKERLAGKPIKPPNSAYSLFSRVMLQSDPDVKSIPPKQRMAEISRKWKEISDSQKMHYEEQVRAMQDTYKLDFASYLEGLSPEEREEELKKNQPKRRPTKAEEKAKKKALKTSESSGKSSSRNKEVARLNLYKGEPEPPPVRVFDVFYSSFRPERSRGLSEEERLKEALKSWNLLSESRKESYRKKHDELKQKYIEDFENFLKSLSPDELKEFSVMKEKAKKNKEAKEQRELINGAGRDSNEDSDDDDNGSSSDSDSDDSDSGKSSKSSSSSEDSEC